MKREKLVCDIRSGCVAIYKESHILDTNGCHIQDERNIAYSNKNAKYNGNHWEMDEETQQIFKDMVDAYNQKETLYTLEQVRIALSEAFKASQEGYDITSDEIIQSLKQPKKD
jgi:hypothetical protein